MVESLASGNRGSSRSRRTKRVPISSDERVYRLSQLFVRRAAALPAEGLRLLEAVLEDRNSDADKIAAAVAAMPDADTVILQGAGVGETIGRREAEKRLDAITVDDESTDWSRSEMVGVGDLAERFGLSRSAIDNWRRAHKALAFSRGVRNFMFPLAQFDGARPIVGLGRVRAHFATDEAAWEWLVSVNPNTGGQPPLEWLRRDRIDEVARAAEGTFDYA